MAIPLPAHLTFIPIDFEQQSLMEALMMGGYRPEVPALFSLLGVTQYLTAEAVWATLRHVATAAAGSELLVVPLSFGGIDIDAVSHGGQSMGLPA